MSGILRASKPDAEAPPPPSAPPAYGDDDDEAAPRLFSKVDCACVGILAFVLLLLSVAITVRISSNCARGIKLDCRIPECQCGTPKQLYGCANFSNPRDAGCTVQDYREYADSGGHDRTGSLAALAFVITCGLLGILWRTTAAALTGRATTNWRPLHDMGFPCGRYFRLAFVTQMMCFASVHVLFFFAVLINILTPWHTVLMSDIFTIVMFSTTVVMSVHWMLCIRDLHE